MTRTRDRIVMRGIAAAPGVAIGPAMVMDPRRFSTAHFHIDPDEVPYEVGRLRRAIEDSRRELEHIRERLGEDAPADYRLILDAHLMMHRDEFLIDGAIQAIENEGVNAEWAVERVVQEIKNHLARASDTYFRDRASDVEHVGKRILAQLAGRSSTLPSMAPGNVLVVDDLNPADAMQLIELRVQALVSELGSATCHTAIVARTLEIPAVMGVSGVLDRVGAGDLLIVDALHGEVVVGADHWERSRAEARAQRYRQFTIRLRQQQAPRIQTRDGVRIELLANMEMPAEAALAVDEKAEGIGLYRTEFLLARRHQLPSEEEQVKTYTDIINVMAPRPVVFRTLDAVDEALAAEQGPIRVSDPSLGLRALRLAALYPEILLTQLRAVLRAAANGPARVMFPFISGVDEIRQARAAIDKARDQLRQKGTAFGEISVGAMIELPAAAVMVDHLANECDFLSVGTNDLVQYTLAVGRSDPSVAYLAEPMNPAVLRLLDMVSRAARDKHIPLSMCGGMASDPVAIPLVVGLGFQSLSVPVGCLFLVREVLGRVDSQQAQKVALEALGKATASEARKLVVERFGSQLGEVWNEAGIEVGE